MPWEGVCSPTVCPPGVGGLPGPEGVVCISPPQAYPPNPPAVGRWGGTPCPGTGMGDVCVPPPSAACALSRQRRSCLLLFFHRQRAVSSSGGSWGGSGYSFPWAPPSPANPWPGLPPAARAGALCQGFQPCLQCRDGRGLLAAFAKARPSVQKAPLVYSTLSCFYFWRRRSLSSQP